MFPYFCPSLILLFSFFILNCFHFDLPPFILIFLLSTHFSAQIRFNFLFSYFFCHVQFALFFHTPNSKYISFSYFAFIIFFFVLSFIPLISNLYSFCFFFIFSEYSFRTDIFISLTFVLNIFRQEILSVTPLHFLFFLQSNS